MFWLRRRFVDKNDKIAARHFNHPHCPDLLAALHHASSCICFHSSSLSDPFLSGKIGSKLVENHFTFENQVELQQAVNHTHARVYAMRYKGRGSASGIVSKLSIIRTGATIVVAPQSVGSMPTKGQMNPRSRVSITASKAGENSQTNGSEHTIVSSILTDPMFKRSNERRAVSSDPLNQQSRRVRATSLKILNWHKYHHQLHHKS
jgi:hypothetical protein